MAGIVIVSVLIALQLVVQLIGRGGQIPSILLLGIMLGFGIRSRARWRRGAIGSPTFAWFLTFLYGTLVPVLIGFSISGPADQSIESIAATVFVLFLVCIGIGVAGTVLVSRASDRRASREYLERKVELELIPPPPPGTV